jgi:predicted nucleic acid-binding protein
MRSVLLDTSFLIRLINRNEALHQNARAYFTYFVGQNIKMYLSSIVIAEYCVKDSIDGLPLSYLTIIPFDATDGEIAGRFYALLQKDKTSLVGANRLAIKDDCKLIAQMHQNNIDAFVTSDQKAFAQYFKPLQAHINIKYIDISTPLSEL